jgi:hypothetical protein
MRSSILWLLAAALSCCADFAAQQAPGTEVQQFVVLASDRMVVPFEALTNDQAHCTISGSGNFATMRCQAPAGTAKASYHYVTALVVDKDGTAYGIVCHESLVNVWCRKLTPGIAIQGSFDAGQKSLSIADGQRSHAYQTLTSAFVGPLAAAPVAPSAKPRPAAAARPQAATAPTAGAPAASGRNGASVALGASAGIESKPQGDAPASCAITAASCVTFVSEPAGADVYVDGKFVGNTPSTLALPAGSHEIRVEADRFKPWTRTLTSTVGSTVTLHAALAKK